MKTRIFSIIMLVTLLPMLVILLLIHVAAAKTLDSFLEKSLTSRATIVNQNIDWIPHMVSIPLQEAAHDDVFQELLFPDRDTGASPELSVEEEARNRMEIEGADNLFIMDKTGEVKLSQNIEEEGLLLNRTKLYRRIMRGAEMNTEIIINSDGAKVLRVSLPIKSNDGSILGIISGSIEPKTLISTVKTMCADICEEVYFSGSSTILSGEENKVEETSRDVPGDFKDKSQLYELMVDLGRGTLEESQGTITYKTQGKQMVGAFVKLKNIDGVMVLGQDKRVIYDAAKGVIITLQGTFFAAILLITIFAIHLARMLYRPIKELCLHTKVIADGDIPKQCAYTGNKEYNEIYRNINRIADNLQRSEEALELAIKRDDLTRIPTAKSLYENIDNLRNEQKDQALLMITFDWVRENSHLFGYDIDDRILQELGHIFRSLPEDTCHPARLTGTRFLLFVSGWVKEETPEDFAKRIIEQVKPLRFIDDISVDIEVSIGIRYIWKGDREEFKEIIRQSGMAMNQGKGVSRNVYFIYHEECRKNL